MLLASKNEASPSSRYLASLRPWFCARAKFRKFTVAWYSSLSFNSRDVIQRLPRSLEIIQAIFIFRIEPKDRLSPLRRFNTYVRSSCFNVKVSCLIIGWISTTKQSYLLRKVVVLMVVHLWIAVKELLR